VHVFNLGAAAAAADDDNVDSNRFNQLWVATYLEKNVGISRSYHMTLISDFQRKKSLSEKTFLLHNCLGQKSFW